MILSVEEQRRKRNERDRRRRAERAAETPQQRELRLEHRRQLAAARQRRKAATEEARVTGIVRSAVADREGAGAAVLVARALLGEIVALAERSAARNFKVFGERNGLLAFHGRLTEVIGTLPPSFEREQSEGWLRTINLICRPAGPDVWPVFRPITDPVEWLMGYDATTLVGDEVQAFEDFRAKLEAFLHEDSRPSDRRRLGELLPRFKALRIAAAGSQRAELFERCLDQIRRATRTFDQITY